jgi:hypothetical protein
VRCDLPVVSEGFSEYDPVAVNEVTLLHVTPASVERQSPWPERAPR